MEARRTLIKYLRPVSWKRVVSFIFLALLAVSVVMAVRAGGKDDKEDARWFHPIYSEEGSYAYLDIVEISDWVYDDGEGNLYYTGGDGEGYLYNILLDRDE